MSNKAYYDIYYEHCSLFMPKTLRYLLRRAGFGRGRVVRLFGGQYLLAVADRAAAACDEEAGDFSGMMRCFSDDYATFVNAWQGTVRRLFTEHGRIALWGAASKAVTFADMMGDAAQCLSAAIDINPVKQGNYLPVTGIPIISPEMARDADIRAAIVVNPNYLPEIERLCHATGMSIRLIPLT